MLGHVFPLVPLARAIRDAGHQVAVATAADALVVAEAGLPVYDIAPHFDLKPLFHGTKAQGSLQYTPIEDLVGGMVSWEAVQLHVAINAELIDGLGTLATSWAPDLVVYEPLAVVAPVVAARFGIPAVLLGSILWDAERVVETVADGFHGHMCRYGVYALPPAAAVLTVAPPSIVGPRAGWPMRAVSYGGEGSAPDWLTRHTDRPRILVSRTTMSGFAGDLMVSMVEAARRIDAQIVLIRPDRRVQEQGDLPDNVHVVDWVPLPAALGACAGIVHPGGAGTTLAALAAGTPQLIAPVIPSDAIYNSRVVAARGAALLGDATAIAAEHLDQLINDTSLRSATNEVRDEIAAMPDPAELVAVLHTVDRELT
jgi:UDP:flavonoid glycosyltransferase YjiC (YdhE family)